MESFEDLGLSPECIEALASEGIERPTPLQETAIPVLSRGNNLVLAAGPGAGTMVTWAAPLLERLEVEGDGLGALILTPTVDVAERLAESLARLANTTGHVVAALGGHWALPERARILFGTPGDVLAAVGKQAISLMGLEVLVIDQAEKLGALGALEPIEGILAYVPKEAQRIVVALPLRDDVNDFVERHVRRATTIPARPADGSPTERPDPRGALRFRAITGSKQDALLSTVGELLADDARHVLVFVRNEDRAADIGDVLTLHGYVAGAPGDPATPVWLGVDALETRNAIEDREGVVVVSADAPSSADDLDRRHGIGTDGIALVFPREIAHLRDAARTAGYVLTPLPLVPQASNDGLQDMRESLTRALDEEDIEAYLLVLAPIFEQYDASQVAAAAVALLRKKQPAAAPVHKGGSAEAAVERAPQWVKVFLTVGERDGLTPRDLVGAITGEANVSGDAVGKIEIKESHSLVDVQADLAEKVIRCVNGTTICGRAVRADVDRGGRRPSGGGGGRGGPRDGGGGRGAPRDGGGGRGAPRDGGGGRRGPGGPRSGSGGGSGGGRPSGGSRG